MYIDIIPNFKTFDTIQPILKNVNASGGNRGVMNKKVQLHDFEIKLIFSESIYLFHIIP